MYVKWYAVACTRPCINKADYREAIQALHIFVQAAFPEAGLSYLTHLFVDLVAKKSIAIVTYFIPWHCQFKFKFKLCSHGACYSNV